VIAQKHVYRGPDEIRQVFTQLLSDLRLPRAAARRVE